MTERKIRVLLCDDQRLFREGLRTILQSERDFEVVGEAADGVEAVETRQAETTPALSASGAASGAALVEPLTQREEEILRLLARGQSNKEIAGGLFLSEGTVKNYISRIYAKLGARDRTQAVLWALDHDLSRE